jgi:hypothetical protein
MAPVPSGAREVVAEVGQAGIVDKNRLLKQTMRAAGSCAVRIDR